MSRRGAGEDPLRRMMRGPTPEKQPDQEIPQKAKKRDSELKPKKRETVQESAPLQEPTPPKQQRGPGKKRTRGSLGGVTTVTDAGKLRKTVYFDPDVWEALQTRAREDKSTGTAIVDASLRAFLEI